MIAATALVLAGVRVLVVAARHQLTGLQIASLAAGLFVVEGRCSLGGALRPRPHGRAAQIPAYLLLMLGWPEITIPGMLG